MPARVIAIKALLKKAVLTITASGQRQASNSSKMPLIYRLSQELVVAHLTYDQQALNH